MPDLLPCPFCGCERVGYHNGWQFGDRGKHIESTGDKKPCREPSITCDGCGMGMVAGDFCWGISDARAEADTKEIWNMRDGVKSGQIPRALPGWATCRGGNYDC